MSERERIAGIWHNEHGSEVLLEVGDDGKLGGRFVSGVGFATDDAYPVTGFMSGSLIVFVARFGKAGSITSWVGHLVETGDEPALQMLWQMTIEVPHPKRGSDELWKTIWSGADTFRRGPAPPERRPAGRRAPPLPLWMT